MTIRKNTGKTDTIWAGNYFNNIFLLMFYFIFLIQ